MGIREDSICVLRPDTPFRDNTPRITRAFWMIDPHNSRDCRPRELPRWEWETVDKANRIPEYRLQLTEAEWPDEINSGKAWTFRAKRANEDLTPIYESVLLVLTAGQKTTATRPA